MKAFNVGDFNFGIILYRNTGLDQISAPERLEKTLKDSQHEFFRWKEALVGYNESKPDYRDCVDLKMSPVHWEFLTPEFQEIKNVYEETETIIKNCLADYEKRYNFKMEYMEAINFVRYEVGQHFQVHSDDGFSYSCTVSSVGYFNDDYEGGEIWFPQQDITFKPQKGDVILFPSNYMYSHASLPVIDGIKYSAVTMFDYNDRTHVLDKDISSNVPKAVSSNNNQNLKLKEI
jgi:hypothetical protein